MSLLDTHDPVGERESNLGAVELLDGGAQCLLSGNDCGLHDLNPARGSPAATSHVLEQGVHGISHGKLTELLVSVMGTTAALVAEPDAVVLDSLGLLLEQFVD